MKRIKKLIVSLFLLMTLSSSCFAQFAVLDAANLTNAIQQMYQTYQQIQHAIEQVQNTYTQIEQAAKQMASTDWKAMAENFTGNMSGIWTYGEFDWNDPIQTITNIKESSDEITKLVETNMNKVNRIGDALRNETIQFGNMKVSVADLCGFGDDDKDIVDFAKNAGKHISDKAIEVADAYTKGLSYQEREAIMRKTGLSPHNYATLQYVNYQLDKKITEAQVKSTFEAMKADLTDIEVKNNMMKKVAEGLPDGSIYAQTKMTNTYLSDLDKGLGKLGGLATDIYGFLASKTAVEKQEKELEIKKAAEEKQMQEELEAKKDIEESIQLY